MTNNIFLPYWMNTVWQRVVTIQECSLRLVRNYHRQQLEQFYSFVRLQVDIYRSELRWLSDRRAAHLPRHHEHPSNFDNLSFEMYQLQKIITSPIIRASSGLQFKPSRADRKNVFSGLPTTVATFPVAYSKPETKGPGPRANPSLRE